MPIHRVLAALLLATCARGAELDIPLDLPAAPTPAPLAAPESLPASAIAPIVGNAIPDAAEGGSPPLAASSLAQPLAAASAAQPASAQTLALVGNAIAKADEGGSPPLAAAQSALDAAFDGEAERPFANASAGFLATRGEQGPAVEERSPGEGFTKETSLHAHSYFSDGTMTPEAVVERAQREGVRKMALSDHDSVAGVRRAWLKAKELGVDFHPAAELTARGGVHVGAVDMDIFNPKLTALLDRVRAARHKHAEGMSDYLNGDQVESDLEKLGRDSRAVKSIEALREFRSRGGRITVEQIAAESKYDEGGTIEMPHVARALLRAGLIANVDDAFDTFFKTLPPLKDVPPDPTVEEVLDVVHAAGGKAFLNHPYTVRGRDDADRDRKAYAILKKGFDGVEAYRPSNATSPDGKRRAAERTAKYVRWAGELNLIVGNGADFHGDDTHLNHIVVWMPAELEAKLLDALRPAQRQALAALERAEPPSVAPGPALGLVARTPMATPDASFRGLPFAVLLAAIVLASALIAGYNLIR